MNKFSVLIVDDQPDFIETIMDILDETEQEYEFFHSVSGKNAYLIAKRRKPTLILTDWEMPKFSGIDFIKLLKTDPDTKSIPVIMVTGKMTNANNLADAFSAGAIDFVRKPIQKVELLARVKSCINIFELQKLEIKLKNQELASYTTFIAQNNQFLNSLLKQIVDFKVQQVSTNPMIKNGIESIEQVIEKQTVNDSWVGFVKHFEKIHPVFAKKVLADFPVLKPSDIKLAILLRLNLSTKEIADISFITPDSVKTARYRLRKKLNLSKNENLLVFLSRY